MTLQSDCSAMIAAGRDVIGPDRYDALERVVAVAEPVLRIYDGILAALCPPGRTVAGTSTCPPGLNVTRK